MLPPAIESLEGSAEALGLCLEQIEGLVDYLFCEPLTVGSVFGSSELDDLCQRVGRRNLEILGIDEPPHATSDATIYIASRLQPSGGHTAALLDVIRLSPKRRSVILVTGVCGWTDYEALGRRLSDAPNVELVNVPPGRHLQKLSWIQKYLHQQGPSIVWLFNHHQDSVAVAAVQPDRGYGLNFYHHGDDRLCLGVCLSFGTHFDISPVLFHRCRDGVGTNGNKYLPLTAIDLLGECPKTKHESPDLVTCTAAGFNKVEVSYFVQYVDVIPRLLCVTGGRHIHIGRLSQLARWRIRRQMKRLGVPSESFVYIPFVNSVWRALYDYKVDLYIASFPYGGGKTMVEVMGAGVPIIAHRNISDRMIGGLDMVYEGARSWKQPEELYQLLKICHGDFLRKQSVLARTWYEKHHSIAVLIQILTDPNRRVEVPQLKDNYASDSLLHACWVAKEVSFVGLFKRQLWRFYRRIKSSFGRSAFAYLLKYNPIKK